MNPYKILLVEDDAEISEMLKNYLETENYEVACALDGQQACAMFDDTSYDLVLLDLMIPKISGMGVMKHIRQSSFVPIIILSAKDSESDKTLGLGLGADDYITKPFSVVEVLARIKASLRRTMQYDGAAAGTSAGEPPVLRAGELTMNLSDYTVKRGEESIDLTAKEFEILKLFMQNPKKVYTKEQIYSCVRNDAYCGDENAVNVHISRLRNKIEDVASRWEGAAQESFIEQFMGDMYPILSETLPQIVEGLASELDAAANAIRETDESLASAFRG